MRARWHISVQNAPFPKWVCGPLGCTHAALNEKICKRVVVQLGAICFCYLFAPAAVCWIYNIIHKLCCHLYTHKMHTAGRASCFNVLKGSEFLMRARRYRECYTFWPEEVFFTMREREIQISLPRTHNNKSHTAATATTRAQVCEWGNKIQRGPSLCAFICGSGRDAENQSWRRFCSAEILLVWIRLQQICSGGKL